LTFGGFASPSSNTVYTPNQFFDVCLPHRSRGCVRVVAYMLRKTLGWSDANGNPIHERVSITYNDLIRHAGVSREMVKGAIDEAMEHGFIRCVQQPSPKRAGRSAVSGIYELSWDERGEYVKDPKAFRGFFAGEGNRTYIPNQFFDVVVRRETLLTAKVVGAIARFSIGFVNKFGHRRTNATLSFADLRRYARIGDTKGLAACIRAAADANYLRVVQPGVFDKTGGRRSSAAIYALRWLNDTVAASVGQKNPPEIAMLSNRSEIPSGIGQKNLAAGRSENPSDVKITRTNKTLKQRRKALEANTGDDAEMVAVSLLKEQGFDDTAAQRIATATSVQSVIDQIEWLPMRGVSRNRLGLLRRAIEGNWPKPDTSTRNFGHPKFAARADDRLAPMRELLAYQLKHKPR
jgi:hypothetical protein